MSSLDKKKSREVWQKDQDEAVINAKAEATKILNSKRNFELSLVSHDAFLTLLAV
jgi:hypothetical protein